MGYNKYHTDLMIASKYGLLKEDQERRIPASTRHSWRNRTTGDILGYNDELLPPDFEKLVRGFATEKHFRTMAKGLYVVNHVLKRMIEGCKEKRALIRSQKEAVLEVVKGYGDKVGRQRILDWFGISGQQLAYWKAVSSGCSLSPITLCRKRYPYQLLPTEVKRIRHYLKDPKLLHWPAISVYYKMLRDGAINCSKSVFYKYMKGLNIERPKPRKDRRSKIGVRASRPFEILHMDCSVFRPRDHSKCYIHLVMDNFSRAVLAHTVSMERSAAVALGNLKKALQKAEEYGWAQGTTLYVDDGTENKGEVEQGTKEKGLKKLIAQKEVRFSNSMVERIFRKLKYEGLYHRRIDDPQQKKDALDKVVEDYMHRPHGMLGGATPEEVLRTGQKGATPAVPLHEAVRRRTEWNLTASCKGC